MRVCGYLVGVELGGDDCDEVLEHLVICSKKEKKKFERVKLGTDNVVHCQRAGKALKPLPPLGRAAVTHC